MGKQKRQRTKLHKPIKNQQKPQDDSEEMAVDKPEKPITEFPSNVFEPVKIEFNQLNTGLNDDIRSVKSFKSIKSEAGKNKQLSKKETIKLRHEYLLDKLNFRKKIDEAHAKNKKRKNPTAIPEDQVEKFLREIDQAGGKKRPFISHKKQKAIKKAKDEKKHLVNLKIYKKIVSNEKFIKNPLGAITEHVQSVVDNEKEKLKHKKKQKTKK